MSLVAVGLVGASCTACGIFPSDPPPPLIGLRVEGGSVLVLIAPCRDETVERATVGELDVETGSYVDPSWSAEGWVGPSRGDQPGSLTVSLSGDEWQQVEGAYAPAAPFWVELESDQAFYGDTVETEAELRDLAGLPEGVFRVNEEPTTREGFEVAAAQASTCA